ncbi:peptide chain release factor N(5)-glutamine methyltransferase [Tenacibaculum sp. S7007]|uniref:Release factor glutamine methyltransferase n=1 Tax=Tenacibaculum pelagium TaxID=2759527 RepID=A0A839AIY7_9FLAO|nr:peptide chain release factor N(5)-glutamine methyltransferase [Tenacibaculum pelagium]MBA6155063.1 peptide chain release factor N(5)-glutamine methyltransferase [Tenacibaculum pelagium]
MRLKNIRTFFNKELEGLYPQTEIDTFFFFLIEEYLGFQRIDLTMKPGFEITKEKKELFHEAIIRLKNEEPIQYILGYTEFYGLPFKVNTNTLIPRPETEELVEWILSEADKDSNVTILDIGTGTGCIPITLAEYLPEATVSAIDVSEEALKIANKNATLNNVSVDFIKKDILKTDELKEYDIIVSNPPYVRNLEKIEIKNNVLENEPHLALFVEDDNPLIFYNKIADLAKKSLTKKGLLFFEINQYLGKETVDMLKEKGFKNIELRKDLFGNDRMIKASL